MAKYIENLEIYSYRGIRDLKINNLGDVNILVGDNNTGKTSVLEAIQLLCEPTKYNLVQIARQREKYRLLNSISLFDSVRYLFDINNNSPKCMNIGIGGTISGESGIVHVAGEIGTQLVDINELINKHIISKNQIDNFSEEVDTFFGKIESTFNNDQQLNLVEGILEEFEINNYTRLRADTTRNNAILRSKAILTIDHVINNAFNDLIKNNQLKNRAVELLKEEFEDDIVDLRIITDSLSRYIPVIEKHNGEYIPLSLYGDGLKKTLTMLNAIINVKGGVVLIDEYETALHTSAMTKVFSFLIESAQKSGVQLFLTTHSLEAIDKMLESADGYAQNIRIIRLRKKMVNYSLK